MPVKRTRSATVVQADNNSSNVTDYMGSPSTKRQKSAAQSANTSARVTRSAQTARVPADEAQSKAAPTRRKTRQQRVDEEDDDDGSVHVAFNQVSSAVNEARFGQPRTINGLQSGARAGGLNDVAEEQDGEEDAEEEPLPPVRKRGRPTNMKQTEQHGTPQSRPTRPTTRSRAEATVGRLYDEPTPRQEVRSRRGEASVPRTNNQKPELSQTRPRQEGNREDSEDYLDDKASAHEHEDSGENSRDAAAQAAEDSAFIDAPRPYEQLPEVNCTVNSLGGMIKTLSHPAWTGVKKWDDDPDMACSTQTGGRLIECLRQLNDLLLDSYDARYEDDADGNPAATIDYLRLNNAKVKSLFVDITGTLDQICTRKLAAGDNLGARGVRTRKRFLCDITKRLMPMLVLVIQKVYDVGSPEEKGSVVHLTLNSFTIQFLLRTTGWATRLAEALLRGLMQWPIDDELAQSDKEAELAQKQERKNKRELFTKQLASLSWAVKKAADSLERQAKEAERKAQEEQHRRRALIRGRELWAKKERERQEAARQVERQMSNFVQASQRLKLMPNPLAEMWKQAVQLRGVSAAPHASQANAAVPVPRPSKGKERAVPQAEDAADFFLNMDNEDQRFNSPVLTGHASGRHRAQNGVSRTDQATEAWGAPLWSKEEEKRLVVRMQSDEKYNPPTMAPKLGRSAEDVARKAAELKRLYRAIYKKRGVSIPAWAW